ncbi:hypothetical protein [uncultured Bacteroides sp.]|uniref:hypothetical protein n=1 Tax=uncultured Bacteroides sp. TaxID=162156 RepID=UPI0025FC3DCE|nr:hypothetical protein [uncultured Bacteroides sp.]
MKNINFKQLLIAADVARKYCENKDCRESFANVLYQNGNGIALHALALKIYNSDENTEYTDEEVNLIKEHANAFCKPFFIDAINRAVEIKPEETTYRQE